MKKRFDSLIFDMDGTLWNAVDSYREIWNVTLLRFGSTCRVTSADLLKEMGKPLDVIFNDLFPSHEFDEKEFMDLLRDNEQEMMPHLGGILYPGVEEGIKRLSRDYKLLMVSNCGPRGLLNFMEITPLAPYFTDVLTNGETGLEKDENIKIVTQRNNLLSPAYVGDIQRDSDAAHKAGVAMIHVTYGFGTCCDADLSFDSFTDLVNNLTKNN